MKNRYKQFFVDNSPVLIFGFLFAFFSGFGQTFLISLYLPSLTKTFSISSGDFGFYYAGVTLLSAFILTQIGPYIDIVPIKKFSLAVLVGMITSVTLLATAQYLPWMLAGLFGIRFFGQGLMSHTSATTVAKYFDQNRGRALSFTTIGHPAGEFALPLVITLGIATVGWRETLFASGVILIIFIFVVTRLRFGKDEQLVNKVKLKGSKRKIFKSRPFWILAPSIFITTFLTTAMFFYQMAIADEKGWSVGLVAGSFSLFAIISASNMLLSGVIIDKYTAKKIFPFYLIPFAAGLLLVVLVDSAWAYPAYMVLAGISVGTGGTLRTAIQTEIYGVSQIGTVRSLFSMLIVVSTALGPAAFGFFINRGFQFESIISLFLVLMIVIIIYSFRIFNSEIE